VRIGLHVLVVDDEKSIQEFFAILLKKEGYEAACASGGEEALSLIAAKQYDLVISDVAMPGMSGLELLQKIKSDNPQSAVLMMTAYSDTESAVQAMKLGAVDYLLKPFKVEEIKAVIGQALECKKLASKTSRLSGAIKEHLGTNQMIGRSQPMKRVFAKIAKVANTRATVLISGESGTGKELVARAIHENGGLRHGPFVSVNCGAIPENLIESELFGYMRGAFTGALQNKRGLFEVAENGTFFLDEVGELPLATQVKLLRVLQEKRLRRVGGTEDVGIRCRVVAATNRNLEDEIRAGRFREDLYYRLNVMPINLPPLRERFEDIPSLVEFFLTLHGKDYHSPVRKLSDSAMEAFLSYEYPGNVRELENLVEQTLAMATQEVVQKAELPGVLLRALGEKGNLEPSAALPIFGGDDENDTVYLDSLLEEYERQILQRALDASGGVKKKAAKLLNISFRSIRYRLSKLGIE
jgi:two-component system response regulator PilR (NtrC family)